MLRAIRLGKGLGVVALSAFVLAASADSATGRIRIPRIPPGAGAKVVIITGTGDQVSANATSTAGTFKDCDVVFASAAIANGAQNNQITAFATCGQQATATAVDSGDAGVVSYDQSDPAVTGSGASTQCTRSYQGLLAPLDVSQWTVTCMFLSFPAQ